MKKLFLYAGMFLCLGHRVHAQDAATVVKSLEAAIRQKSVEQVKPLLSPSFHIGFYPAPYAYGMLDRAFRKDSLDKLVLKKEEKTTAGKRLLVKYYNVGQKPFETYVYLNGGNQLEKVQYYDLLAGINLDKPSRLAAVIPFTYQRNRIVISLTLNDSKKPLRLLFDTGADGMGLKKSVADEIGITANRQQKASVVGASTQIGIASGIVMHLDTLVIPNNNSAIFPQFDADLDGLFGANFLRNYITEIDFDSSVIRLYTFGKFDYNEKASLIPLDYSLGVPGIKGKATLNNGKVLDGDFHFDTGAGYPLILFGPSVHRNQLDENFQVTSHSTTTSMGHSSPVVNGVFNGVDIGQWHLNSFTGTLQTYREGDEKWSPKGDGSFGIELINRFNWVINLADHQFSAIPNKNFAMPSNFWMKDIEWGFAGGKMIVKRVAPGTGAADSGIMENDEVMAINGVKVADLTTEANIKKYSEEWNVREMKVEVNKFGKPWKIDIP
ncbi:PDZ domain (Also known as DHR or GLGF) [Chitinophaga jiangningensis]|uniref:PDZ domain (Also known as DHR or GLGF) n=1 Tax=Chitinophaga jiangningensis TaxID=1419482 RepID=A0A1M7E784_9BACT|nr:aspartyl protease family protein [Chitinophaga jiangningensis]SHL87526.1 PDZ domain (Also known as DHR or GLGF) [Chitinophaga jiangningensis]